jgi:tetratricopeptide (TPR) repeat protein
MKSYLYESKNCETANNVAMVNLKLGNKEMAIKYFKIAIRNNPYYLTAINNLADLYLSLRNMEKAKKLYEKVTSMNPQYAAKINIKYRVFSYTNKLNTFREYSHSFYGLGQIFSMKDKRAKSERFFIEALKYMPGNDMVMFRLAIFYVKYGEINKAKKLLLRVIKINGNFAKHAKAKLDTLK